MSKFIVASAAAAIFAAVANAQSAPDWNLIPKACASDCAKTIEASYLCQKQYSVGTLVYGCFCQEYPSDADACATCLNSNNAAALGTLLTGTKTDCPAQQKACAFQCAFDTCDSKNVPCQCDAGYLSNIYNCASCNTANGNSAGTQVTDFNALKESCANQNFTGASQEFNTWVQAPTGTAEYTAPTLTATGGGDAATGTFLAATDKAAATDAVGAGSVAASGSGSASATGASSTAASPSSTGSAKPSAPTTGSATGTGAPATTSKGSGAIAVAAPAGLVAFIALAATIF